ncbi:MAG: ABC transporter ATP-binding protein [Nitrospirae bacterium]|nr:ABC transporter ATP-binding protein [Nitrospirota bacterium]
MDNLLSVNGLIMDFGGLRALEDLDLHVKKGEILALIGPNGAGKTTFFNCLTGIYRPAAGDICLTTPGGSMSIAGLPPHVITKKGIARTFQNIRLFPNMTVIENVMAGRHCRTNTGIAGAIFRGRAAVKEELEVVERSYEIIKKAGLARYVNELAKNLPYGEQRRLEIARALATEPLLLLLDEPAAGLNSRETKELDMLISEIRDLYKISILLIEHDMKLVMSISDRVAVMDYGKKIAEGRPDEISRNSTVIKAYLGEEFVA